MASSEKNSRILTHTLQGAALAVAYYLTGWVGVHARVLGASSSIVWFPTGFGLAALLIFGNRVLPWIFVADFFVHLNPNWVVGSVFFASSATFTCWLGSELTRRFVSPRPDFSTLRQVLAFVVVITIDSFIGAGLNGIAFTLTTKLPIASALAVWRPWCLAGTLGELFLGGTLLCWWNGIRFRTHAPFRFEWDMAFLSVALLVVAVFSYTSLATRPHSLLLRPYMLFPLMIWVALRFDLFGATLAGLLVGSIASAGAAMGFRFVASVPAEEGAILQQLHLLSWAIVGFVLAAATREKKEAIEARNEFLSIASHELKTPVTSLALQLQLFQRQLLARPTRSEDEDRWLGSFQRANGQMGRLGRLVEQLLDMSRIDCRDLSLQYESVDLATLIRKFVERRASEISQAGCTLELALVEGVRGRWDPCRVEQVLDNLLSNAIKYAPGTSIRITTSLALNGSAVEIMVADHGPGIAKEKQERIFDRFFRAERRASPVRGLGLGLFISREIVHAHRGMIWVDSHLGQGTQFRVRMPLNPETAPPP